MQVTRGIDARAARTRSLIFAVGFSALALQGCGQPSSQTEKEAPRSIATPTSTAPSGATELQAIQTYYPLDYADYQRRFGKHAVSLPPEAVGPAIEWRRSFLTRMRTDLLRAPHADLSRYMATQLAEIRAFANVSADACVRYATSAYGPDEPYPPSVMPAVTEAITAKFQAASEGRLHPARSVDTRASRSDVLVLVALLERRGVSREEMAEMAGAESMARLPVQRRCAYFVELPSATLALPSGLADRLWVTTLAEPGALGAMVREAADR